MSSLLRSPAIRRALSAASSGGRQGGSFLRAPSAAAPAAAGEGVAAVRRGLGLPTAPRRHLSGQEHPPALTADQVKQHTQIAPSIFVFLDNILCTILRHPFSNYY